MSARRIVSLLPSATEIVYALGLEDRLVAVTHECDFPPAARDKPQATRSVFDAESLTSRQIDQAVRDSLAEQATIYHLDRDLLAELRPDLILTQELCEVCAVGTDEVRAVIETLPERPRVVSLEPRTLDEVLRSILTVGDLCDVRDRAEHMVAELRVRLDAVRSAVSGSPSIPVLTLEWVDPVFVGGHWVPEMVALAGGHDILGLPGQPSREVTWEDIAAHAPGCIVAMPCGFGLARAKRELEAARMPHAWYELRPVREGQIWAVDGSSYFNRPGPRLIDGVEILASILHPDRWMQAPPESYAPFPVETPAG